LFFRDFSLDMGFIARIRIPAGHQAGRKHRHDEMPALPDRTACGS
jgi:hypothetical protein